MTDNLKAAGDRIVAASKDLSVNITDARIHQAEALSKFKSALLQHVAQTGDVAGAEKVVDSVAQALGATAQEVLQEASRERARDGIFAVVPKYKGQLERLEEHATYFSSMADGLKADIKHLAHISHGVGKGVSAAIPEAVGTLARQAVGPQTIPEGRKGGR